MAMDQYMAGPGMPQSPYPPNYPQPAPQDFPGYPPPVTLGHQPPIGYQQPPRADRAPSGYQEPFGVNRDYSQTSQPPGGRLSNLKIPMWLVTVIGYILSAVIGITVGYLLISWLVPDSNLNLFR